MSIANNAKIGYTVTDENGNTSDVAYLIIHIADAIVIPDIKGNQIITPNGDNSNDYLIIANTDVNFENTLSISDEVGNVVYATNNYQNDWSGNDAHGRALAAGMYYYYFKELEGKQQEIHNYLQIVR